MECDLELGGDGEEISGYERVIVSADVVHFCLECEREIPAGIQHERVTGEFQGEPIEWRTCMDCTKIGEALQTEGRTHGLLWEELEDYGGMDGEPAFEQFNTACLARVETASAKTYLQERYLKWKGLPV